MTSEFFETSPHVELRLLRHARDGAMTFFVRMKQGARAPLHVHPGGEETYMIDGILRITERVGPDGHPADDARVSPGEYFYAPPGERHSGVAETDALFFVVAAGGVATVP